MHISQAYHSPNYSSRNGTTIDAVVVHSCEGSPPGNEQRSSIPWLCNPKSGVSAHYYITRAGDIYQLVSEEHRAHHAGICSFAPDANSASIGIELEHRAGSAPYPQAQMDALSWLVRDIVARYAIPLDRIYRHGTVALPVGRKSDPTDWPEASFRVWVASLLAPPASSYTEYSPILLPANATHTPIQNVIAAMQRRNQEYGEYTQYDVYETIMPTYWKLCANTGLDPVLVWAQCLHETAWLSSWWAARPRRNPAGIGVSGETLPATERPGPGWAMHPDGRWHKGMSYRTWINDAIPHHVGHLLAYLLPTATGTATQRALIADAHRRRLIDPRIRGSVRVLKHLGRVHNESGLGWASPGGRYGAAIAEIANQIRGKSNG